MLAAAAAAAACCDRFSSEPAAPASDAGGRAGWPAVSYAADGDDVDGSRNPKLLPKPKPCVPSRPGERKAASVNAWYPVRTGSSGLYGSVPGGWAGAGSVQRRRDGCVQRCCFSVLYDYCGAVVSMSRISTVAQAINVSQQTQNGQLLHQTCNFSPLFEARNFTV